MHRQKTIAKWLAVILSLTIAVACYIALSAITDGKSNDNVAGANDNEYPPNQIPQTPSPVYSVLPRKCEIIGDKNIAHFGGEAEEKMLDAFVFANKNVMIVSCDSKQYDVSETGIYLAIFDKTSLEKVVKITEKSGSYLSRCQTRNGLAIFCAIEGKTHVVLFDEKFEIYCENTIDEFDMIHSNYIDGAIETFCIKNGKIKHIVFDDSLNTTTSNFVLQTTDAKIIECINFGENSLLFLQDGEYAVGAIYNKNNGFIVRFSYNKHRILQILPTIQSSSQAFSILCQTDEGLAVYSCSESLETTAKYTLKGERFGALLKVDNGVAIVCKKEYVRLCSHLDFISKAPLEVIYEKEKGMTSYAPKQAHNTCDGAMENPMSESPKYVLENAIGFSCVLQEENLFVIRFADIDFLVEFKDGTLAEICRFKYNHNAIVWLEKTKTQNKISVFFDCDSSTDSTYMCFGKTDAFFISILTSAL